MASISSQSPIFISAIEAFNHGLEHCNDNSDKSRRFAFLHVDQAIELILKEKLVSMGVSIYKRDKETLGIHEAFKSLESRGVNILEKPRIEELHVLRDMIQHKGFTPQEHVTKFYLKIAYEFISRFLKDEMSENIESYISIRVKGVNNPTKEDVLFLEQKIEEQIKLAYKEIERNPSSAIMNIFIALEFVVYRKFKYESLPIIIEKLKEMSLIDTREFKGLESFYALRNRVVHTSYIPTKEEAGHIVENIAEIIKRIKSSFL